MIHKRVGENYKERQKDRERKRKFDLGKRKCECVKNSDRKKGCERGISR